MGDSNQHPAGGDAEARNPHLIDGEFQSDKYPTTPRGKVPLSVKDKTAQDLLWEYAQRRRVVDAEFADDLEIALRNAGYLAPAKPEPSRIAKMQQRAVQVAHELNGRQGEYVENHCAIPADGAALEAAEIIEAFSSHITAIEADRDRMREALEWIRDELPDRDDWDNFEEHSALVLRMRAKARAALNLTSDGVEE